MCTYEPLQPDKRRQAVCIADTRTIVLIASKRNFEPDKEGLLIERLELQNAIVDILLVLNPVFIAVADTTTAVIIVVISCISRISFATFTYT